MLLLEAGMIGVFVALDLVLFFVFWELTLIPMYFLIGGWGDPHGTYNFLGRSMPWRIYAALKFFLYTLAGSALMLVAILVLYCQGGTFDLLAAAEDAAWRRTCRSGSSWRLRWPLPSRCRSSRSTPGCPTPTWQRRPAAR